MYERFEILLSEKGIKAVEVGRATGINPSTFTTWKKGTSTPKQSTLKKIADYFDVSLSWLIGESDDRETDTGMAKIPVVGLVAAGIPITAHENVIGYEEVPKEILNRGDYFGLRIKGDSMNPAILDGDIVIVRKQNTADTGDIVIALVNGEDGVCKKLIKKQDGIVLHSLNETYGDFSYTNEQISSLPVIIVGKVEQLRRNF